MQRIQRDQALFPASSRLYSQADEGAREILAVVKNEPLREIIDPLKCAGLMELPDSASIERATSIAFNQLIGTAAVVDPRTAVPILLELLGHYYYYDNNAALRERLPWLGTAAKTALAAIWPNRFKSYATNRSVKQLVRCIYAAAGWGGMRSHRDQSSSFGFGFASIDIHGFRYLNLKDHELSERLDRAAAPRGQNQRSVPQTVQLLWKNYAAFEEAILEVLSGQDPAGIPLFGNSFFESTGLGPGFWLGLYLRLALISPLLRIKSPVQASLEGICLFEEFAVAVAAPQLGHLRDEIARRTRSLFWQQDWHQRRFRDEPQNMIVERPALRIDDRTMVCLPLSIPDSVNSFIESAICRMHSADEECNLEERVFLVHFAQPFENRVNELFRSHRWQAGGVDANGLWAYSGQLLRPVSGAPPPGEIDMLAVSPDGTRCIIGECKALSLPHTTAKMKNLVSKLGPSDSEGFHSKLDRKAAWVQSLSDFFGLSIRKIIITDRFSVLGADGPNMVADLDDIEDILREQAQDF